MIILGRAGGVRTADVQACSRATRAVCVISDACPEIAKDRDGDATVTGFWAYTNNTAETQTVHATLRLDGPCTSHDQTYVGGWVIAPGEIQ